MMKEKISVCMATYNGAKYIKEQLDSILCQIRDEDEIIVSDDNSTDETVQIVHGYNDSRIKYYQNFNGKGPVKNFENAISKATGDLIFLSDQDDIWRQDKVSVILNEFGKNEDVTCIFTNAEFIDKKGNRLEERVFPKVPVLNLISILYKNNFLGGTMAFRKNNVSILPFPHNLPMHDWFIGLKHILKGKVIFIDQNLIFYRRHDSNVTTGKSAGFFTVLKWRFQILKALIS